MSDDFQTVSAKRGDRAREIETLRARYRKHREALTALAADAPSELIAADYRRVIADIDVALAKLDEAAPVPPPPPPPAHPARRGIESEPPRLKTEPGMRPLVTPAAVDDDTGSFVRAGGDSRRLLIIGVLTVLALTAIAFIWKPWARNDEPGAIVEQPVGTATAGDATVAEEGPVTPAPARAAAGRPLTVSPDTIDYGVVRKGTRVTRQYELVNNSDEPLSPEVERSTCRCLYYEYAPVIPPRGKETLTVTIDGVKAKAGPLLESIRVTSKADPSVVATFDVTATVR